MLRNHSFKISALALLTLIFSGCSSTRRTQPGIGYGPALPENRVGEKALNPENVPRPTKLSIGIVVAGNGVTSFATVGILKRLAQEGVTPEYIVATGWPALFAVAYGLLPSANDMEWFAMKLKDKDLGASSGFAFTKESVISDTLASTFGTRDLASSRIPLIVMAPSTDTSALEIYDRGDWRFPISRSLVFPGLYKPFPKTGVTPWSEARALDVTEGIRRGADRILVFSMYGDYLQALEKAPEPDARNFSKRWANDIRDELQKSSFSRKITLNRNATEFGARRAAIQAGSQVAAELLKQVRRRPASEESPAEVMGPAQTESEPSTLHD